MTAIKAVTASGERHQNTDWLRALAISLVLIHHIGQNLEALPPMFLRYFKLGAHGVDLFFVLSGWLIGGLYWRERQRFGNVDVMRFLGRRWLRTLPPYFVMLPIAYLAVYLFRQQPFDWSYLFFTQNYRDQMPFFLVSWSLAVEEHFYLLLPLILGLFTYFKVSMLPALGSIIVLMALSRFIDPAAQPSSQFGYAQAASHFHFTGLLLGVGLARIKYDHSELWSRITTNVHWPVAMSLLLFVSMPVWGLELRYYFGNTVAVLASACLLVLAQTEFRFWFSGTWAVSSLALCSYSVYLTHALVINAGLLVADRINVSYLLASPLLLLIILVIGWLFYISIEKTCIAIRDRYVRRREGPLCTQ